MDHEHIGKLDFIKSTKNRSFWSYQAKSVSCSKNVYVYNSKIHDPSCAAQ